MKTERQQDQDVAERLRRENLERVEAGGCAPPVMVAEMPKDNKVDEKVVAFAVVVDGEPDYANVHKWACESEAGVYGDGPIVTIEPLTYAATVAELRAEVVTERLRGELDALEQFLRMAAEPIGQECCGQGRYECCGDPIPVFAQPHEVFQAMSERHAEILASLATLTGADPT